jgi:hypothetical protein
MRVYPKPAEDFLRDHVTYAGDNCVIWPFAKKGGGRGRALYGAVKIGGIQKQAHRCMCILANGEPPTPSHEAAHSCHNPACINPRHLRWATRLENEGDKNLRGTRPKGEHHANARLSDEDVRAIRADRRPQREIAKSYGISQTPVSKIKRLESWKHIQG